MKRHVLVILMLSPIWERLDMEQKLECFRDLLKTIYGVKNANW